MIHNALVVDDSRTARFMLAKILQRLGVATATANSAEEALTYLDDHVPDAIFIDHVMPGIDGLHATRQIKRDPRFAAVPIVIFTAKEGDEYIAQAKSFGAYSVLTKPPTDDFVRSLLDELALDAAMSGNSGVANGDDAPALVDQPAPGTAAPGPSEDAVARAARQAVDEALGARLETALDALLATRLETLRHSLQAKRYANGVATYMRKETASLADKLVAKHVTRLRDDLVSAQAAAGRKGAPLLSTLLAGLALTAAAAALLLLLR